MPTETVVETVIRTEVVVAAGGVETVLERVVASEVTVEPGGIETVVEHGVSSEIITVVGPTETVVETALSTQIVTENIGAIGPVGPAGPQGPAGAGAYTHTQFVASSTWTINHNFNRRPSITVLSTGGKEMVAEVLHSSVNQALVLFDDPQAGTAIAV